MAQIDANATKEQLAQMEREFARKRATAAERRRAELARLSDERTFADDNGTIWTYVVVDSSFTRILACQTAEESLVIPDEIAGLPVLEVGTEALSHLATPREIICAPAIQAIGPYAFRACENLTRLVLPESTDCFLASWVSLCSALRELVLPDALPVVTADVLANRNVAHLRIGANTHAVQPGAFEKSRLSRISVSDRNTHLATDGACLYSADGTLLVALARPVETYAIASGCTRIAKKAFAGFGGLRQVTLPEGLQEIGDFAFAYSGIEEVICPTSLRTIDQKAYLHCKSLSSFQLNEDIEAIGDEAFADSGLGKLRIPASILHIGHSITRHSKIRHSGADATFSIDPSCKAYFVDESGCLYQRCADGLHLAQMLEPDVISYRVNEACTRIDEKAFAHHDRIEEVELPDGVASIGEGAFRVCRNLRHVRVPDSLESVGKDAFIDTELNEFRIPAGLTDIGSRALVTDGAHHEGKPPALRRIDLDERNPRFFMHTGMLCRRTGRQAESASVVTFTNSCENVAFPDNIEAVEDYAFNNAFSVKELSLNARLRSIGACGLSVMCAIRSVRIDVATPIEGRSSFQLHFPAASRSVHGFLLALSGNAGCLHLPDIMSQYDSCIAAARDYHAPRDTDNASAYEQVKLIIERLNDSVLLTPSNRQRYHNVLADNIEEICVDIARHDDRATMADLADLGFLNESNLEDAIAAVSKLQDAAMTGYLLEMKRVRFSHASVDFDL